MQAYFDVQWFETPERTTEMCIGAVIILPTGWKMKRKTNVAVKRKEDIKKIWNLKTEMIWGRV